jgi:isoleucyl-tRNA synthetase
VCLKHGIIEKGTSVPCPVDANGRFTAEVPDFVGRHVKEVRETADDTVCRAGRPSSPVCLPVWGNFSFLFGCSYHRCFPAPFPLQADNDICTHLKSAGRLVDKSSYVHSYPFCWRSDTPLIYKAVPAWFVRVESVKERLLANNAQTYWVPAFVKEVRPLDV